MIPYGGPVVQPPVQRVNPPSPRERRQARRLLLLIVLFAVGAYCLLLGGDEHGYYVASGTLFVAWLAVKICWKKE